MHQALSSAETFPQITLAKLGGGEITLGKPETGDWQLIFIYRGLHCPICKQYLTSLEEVLPQFQEMGIEVVAASADPEEKAKAFQEATGSSLPIGIDLSVAQMQTLGLYISDPRSPKETDRPFAEPGLFLVNPEGKLHMVDISNAPFLRPDLGILPGKIKFALENDYPIRGTHSG